MEILMHPLITMDSSVRFGKACVRGTRITVADVLGALAAGQSIDDICSDFPQLSVEAVLACLAFAADRERNTVSLRAA
jgi:uncharacterized protein (DUF433 family)